jgi:hypothetical protein
MRSESVTDGIIVELIEDLTDIAEMVDAIPEFVADLPDLVQVRFFNVASRRPGTSADWPPPPKKPAPKARDARIFPAVMRPPTSS